MSRSLNIAFFGSSLVSSYWNGACTYYRGIIRALHERGHRVTFWEPDAYDRQRNRDMDDPPWARVVVYEASDAAARRAVGAARGYDVVVKCSGVGVCDDTLAAAVLELPGAPLRIFWDVDAPATLAGMEEDESVPLRAMVPQFDLVLTYGGGSPVVERYAALGARRCVPIYNALDPTTHHPVPPVRAFAADLTFLGNRLPDREARVIEFFFEAARRLPHRTFLLGGSGWEDYPRPSNVCLLGHVATHEHNALNCSALAVLNVSRASMAANGYSPATRVFEAAGAGACLITDAWRGLEMFLEPGQEVLAAGTGAEVADLLAGLDPERARQIGTSARRRVLAEHTYAQRAEELEAVLSEQLDASAAARPGGAAAMQRVGR